MALPIMDVTPISIFTSNHGTRLAFSEYTGYMKGHHCACCGEVPEHMVYELNGKKWRWCGKNRCLMEKKYEQ